MALKILTNRTIADYVHIYEPQFGSEFGDGATSLIICNCFFLRWYSMIETALRNELSHSNLFFRWIFLSFEKTNHTNEWNEQLMYFPPFNWYENMVEVISLWFRIMLELITDFVWFFFFSFSHLFHLSLFENKSTITSFVVIGPIFHFLFISLVPESYARAAQCKQLYNTILFYHLSLTSSLIWFPVHSTDINILSLSSSLSFSILLSVKIHIEWCIP